MPKSWVFEQIEISMIDDSTKQLVFYDNETSGLSPEYDQIFQFAAVVTDSQLNEIESVNLRCRRHPHIVPAFGALMTTGINPETLDQANMSNYDMASELTELFHKWSPATFIGYNTIRFDESFLRQLFYKNLYPIYQTQVMGNGRLDILKLVSVVLELEPNILRYALTDKGKPNKKLESLALLNGFQNHNAHDALGDVRATIFLAKILKERCPDVWADYFTSRSKHLFEDALYQKGCFTILDTNSRQKFGKVLCSTEDQQGLLCFDLIFAEATKHVSVNEWLAGYSRKKPSPFFRLRTNTAAFVRPMSKKDVCAAKPSLNFEPTFECFEELQKDSQFLSELKKIETTIRMKYPLKNEPEEQIYNGFPSSSDQQMMKDFHLAPIDDKLSILSQIQDSRFRTLGLRVIAENWPDSITVQKRNEFIAWARKRITDNATGNSLIDELNRSKKALFERATDETLQIEQIIKYYELLSTHTE